MNLSAVLVRQVNSVSAHFAAAVSLLLVVAGSISGTGFAQQQSSSVTPARKTLLTCPEVRARVGQFLDLHYVFRNFDNELSRRTYKKLFESFDSSKYYFLASDVAKFSAYEDKIDDMITRADCKFVLEIHDLLLQRVKERNLQAMALLEKPFTFNTDDEIAVGKLDWAKDNAELTERWRKRIKFQVLNMKDTDGEAKARERLKKRYEQIKRALEEQTNDEVFNSFLNSFALALDPHSTHFLPAEQEDFQIRLGNQLEGIGATLQETDGYITVQALIPGGAASRDGRIKVGDKIIGVDSGDGSGMTDVIDMDLSKAVRLIRGKKGTLVKLLVLRKTESGNERLSFSLVRDAVKISSSEAKSETMDLGGKKLGVIRLTSFYTDFSCRMRPGQECKGAAHDINRELKKLMATKVDGLILDLRGNGGGDLQESIRLTGLFIPEGTVVQTVDRKRVTRTQQDQDPSVMYSGPMVVLINKYSASASEIVAGALQDYGRAVVLGDSHTYGKATVQVVQDITGTEGRSSNGAIKVTQAKFYRPSGKSNQEKGVESDLTIPSLLEVYDVGEKENEYVLKYDTIKPAPDFKPLQNLAPLLVQLTQMSGERVAKAKEFQELKEKSDKYKKEKDKATTPLKEDVKKQAERKKEREQEEQDVKDAREENLIVRKSDIQLREAANVLADAIELTKTKSNWISSVSR